MKTPANTHVVIMAGGSGTRFWPASRELRPKQLLPLANGEGVSLLAGTLRRLDALASNENTYVVTSARLKEATATEAPSVPVANILAEPVPRNTAAAVGWATSRIARKSPHALVAVFPSDHYVADEDAFASVVRRALRSAKKDRVATIGIVPTRPETGYGYIQRGEEIEPGVFRAVRFVEKPVRPVAEQYVASGSYVWNAGMFFFPAKVMLEALEAHLPDLAAGLREIDDAAKRGPDAEDKAVAALFPQLPSISVDHGVMERLSDLAVVPGEFGWNDVGSWQSAWELAGKDAAGNAVPQGTIAQDAHGNLVCDLSSQAGKRVFALVGVSDLVLVETDDAVLILPRDRAQDVRSVVDTLKKTGRSDRL